MSLKQDELRAYLGLELKHTSICETNQLHNQYDPACWHVHFSTTKQSSPNENVHIHSQTHHDWLYIEREIQ